MSRKSEKTREQLEKHISELRNKGTTCNECWLVNVCLRKERGLCVSFRSRG
jgi:hypothetical protein